MGQAYAGVARMAALVACLLLSASPSLAFDPFLGPRVEEAVAAGRTGEALELLERGIAAETEARVLLDIRRRKAELVAATGTPEQAAAAWSELAAQIEAGEGALAPDLVPVLDGIAAARETAGDLDGALEALARILDILRNARLLDETEPYVERIRALAEKADTPATTAAAETVIQQHDFAMAEARSDDRAFDVDPEKGFSTVRIYYATDRARTGSELPNDFYGGDRGTLELGAASVTIPEQHRPGAIEKPSIWTLDFREDPERHVVLASVTPGDADAVFGAMRDHLAESGSDEAFVFVHGFNVPFHEAAQRTAQMAFDMNFEGLPILFSWPSRASLLSYIADTAVVNLSGRRLSLFLEDVVARSGATRIHLIAHSMGNRALTDALELFALRYQGPKPAFGQVLFTAPDLDAGLFAEMMKTIRPIASRITLYASNSDWALAVSRQLHGDAARAGQGGKGIVHLAEIDSIDMTDIGEDMLAHSYYANNPSALTDILSLFWRDAPPEKRCGMAQAEGDNGGYWQYSPEECDSGALLSTLSFLRRGSIATVTEARLFMNRFIISPTTDMQERSRLEGALSRLFGG